MSKKFDGRKFVREMMCRPARYRAYMERVIDGDSRTWKRWNIEERAGWIVGATFLQTGERCPGSGGISVFGGDDDYEPPTFDETSPRMLVYLVTPWPTARPRHVLPEDVEIVSEGEAFDPSAWDSASRELASQWSRDYLRGKGGKWEAEARRREDFGRLPLLK